jgi:hypothetical protein
VDTYGIVFAVSRNRPIAESPLVLWQVGQILDFEASIVPPTQHEAIVDDLLSIQMLPPPMECWESRLVINDRNLAAFFQIKNGETTGNLIGGIVAQSEPGSIL